MATFRPIEIQENRIKVQFNTIYGKQTTVVAKYEDANGVYFYDQDLEKQYTTQEECDRNKHPYGKPQAPAIERKDEVKEYRFMVEYEHKGRANNFATKLTSVMAKSYEKALEKVYAQFKNIYEISEY